MPTKLHFRAAALVAGSLGLRAQTTLYTVTGDTAADQLGRSVALLPDIDGDGVEDFAVGAPFDDPKGYGAQPGSVKLYSGKTGALLRTILGDGANSEFGHAIAGVPDVNGDGRYDILIGAPSRSYSLNHQGAAYVYTSNTGQKWDVHFGSGTDEFFGTSVANLGDIDLDGVEDYAVGAPFADVGGYTDNGRVKVYSGADGGELHDWWQGADYGQFGWSIASAGDTNGDGRSDYLIGAPAMSSWGWNHNGTAYLFTGGGWAAALYQGNEDFQQLGWSLAGIGDVNGDGHSEYAIGSPYFDGAGTSHGRVRVYSWSPDQFRWDVEGSNGWLLGDAMAGIGDFDGDGVRDLAVGVPGYVLLGSGQVGAVRVYSGSNGAFLTTLLGADDDSAFGCAVAGGRDLNNDGRCELLIGASSEDANGTNSGAARLILGDAPIPSSYGTAKVNSSGCTPHIAFSGAPSRTLGDNFHISAHNIVPNKAGMLFWGFVQSNAPFHGGFKLVGNPIVRTGAQNSGFAFGTCTGAFDWHFSQAQMLSAGLQPGIKIYAQYWYRDAGFAFPDNVGLTNALQFPIVP